MSRAIDIVTLAGDEYDNLVNNRDDLIGRIAALEAKLAEHTRELDYANERAASHLYNAYKLRDELATERARLETVKNDAARYQWLKINARRIDFAGLCVSDGAQLDARIDAARKD